MRHGGFSIAAELPTAHISHLQRGSGPLPLRSRPVLRPWGGFHHSNGDFYSASGPMQVHLLSGVFGFVFARFNWKDTYGILFFFFVFKYYSNFQLHTVQLILSVRLSNVLACAIINFKSFPRTIPGNDAEQNGRCPSWKAPQREVDTERRCTWMCNFEELWRRREKKDAQIWGCTGSSI